MLLSFSLNSREQYLYNIMESTPDKSAGEGGCISCNFYVLSRIPANRQTAINRRSRAIVMGKDGTARNFEKIECSRDDDRCGAVRRGK